MPRKVIIDCDPGIDDAVALALALLDPRLEVVAVTATAGIVSTDQAIRNVQALIERLDPPRHPRIGEAVFPESAYATDTRQLHGDDGLGNAGYAVSKLQHLLAADKLIGDEVRAAPEQVTIICLGPLTNLARALQRDPQVAGLIGRLIIVGGSVQVGGNATPAAEYHMFWDPEAARAVFHSSTAKTLVPLDVTRHLNLTMAGLDELPSDATRTGAVLRRLLGYYFRAHHQLLGLESIPLHDVAGVLAALHPELFHTMDLAGDVETRGEVTHGATVFDRRHGTTAKPNMEVALEIDAPAALDCLLRGLRAGERRA